MRCAGAEPPVAKVCGQTVFGEFGAIQGQIALRRGSDACARFDGEALLDQLRTRKKKGFGRLFEGIIGQAAGAKLGSEVPSEGTKGCGELSADDEHWGRW